MNCRIISVIYKCDHKVRVTLRKINDNTMNRNEKHFLTDVGYLLGTPRKCYVVMQLIIRKQFVILMNNDCKHYTIIKMSI